MTAKFEVPEIVSNPSGWGPNAVPERFKDMPYQPFSKSDRLGKITDWTGSQFLDRRYVNRYAPQYGAGGTQYAYYHEEDESSFHLVDTSKNLRPLFMNRGRFGRGMRGGRGGRGMPFNAVGGRGNNAAFMANQQMAGGGVVLSKAQKNKERERMRQQRKWQQQQRGRHNFNRPMPVKQRESSVTVRPEWVVIEEMEKTQLTKLSLPIVNQPIDLTSCGEMEYYDKSYDRVNVKLERPLKRIDRVFHTVSTTDDPIIRKLARTEEDANVFATDTVLATLMCCTRSVYSWDIVVQKIGGKVFLDKRDNTEFDLLTVSETSAEPPSEEMGGINAPRKLALEATFVNHNFSQQVLKLDGEKHKFQEPNPFADDEEEGAVASVGYRYRKWDLDNGIKIVARCEHDAVAAPATANSGPGFITIRALNEWDPKLSGGIDWRQRLDNQRGAVLANELKNNACKLAKWTVQALLAGSDQLKLGYVTRFNVKDSSRHTILGTQPFRPSEFAAQINLSMDNAWGIVRCVVDLVMKQEDGKYLIVKDPNKPVIRLYDIPDNTFESDDDSDYNNEDIEEALESSLKH